MRVIRTLIIIIAAIAAFSLFMSLVTVLYLESKNQQIPDMAVLGFEVALILMMIDVFLLVFLKNGR